MLIRKISCGGFFWGGGDEAQIALKSESRGAVCPVNGGWRLLWLWFLLRKKENSFVSPL